MMNDKNRERPAFFGLRHLVIPSTFVIRASSLLQSWYAESPGDPAHL